MALILSPPLAPPRRRKDALTIAESAALCRSRKSRNPARDRGDGDEDKALEVLLLVVRPTRAHAIGRLLWSIAHGAPQLAGCRKPTPSPRGPLSAVLRPLTVDEPLEMSMR